MPGPIPQSAFVGGEIAPALHGRTDLQRYAQSAKRLENFVVDPIGGISNRQGLKFIGLTKQQDGKQVRLIPFVPSADAAYVLEFGHEYLRVWTQYGPALSQDHPKVVAQDAALQTHYEALTDVVFNPPNTNFGFTRAQKFVVPATGNVLKISSVEFQLVRFQAGPDTPGQISVAIFDDNGGLPGAAVVGYDFADFTEPNPQNVRPALDDTAWHRVYATNEARPELSPGSAYHIVILCESNPAAPIQMLPASNLNPYSDGGMSYFASGAWNAVGTTDLFFRVYGAASGIVELVTPYQSLEMDDDGTESELRQLVFAQSVDVMTITHPNHAVHRLSHHGEGSWVFERLTIVEAPGKPLTVSAQIVPTSSDPIKWAYAVAGVSRDGIESAALETAEFDVGFEEESDVVRLAITGSRPVDHFAVYKGRNGTFGFIGVAKMPQNLTELWDAVFEREYKIAYAEIQGQQQLSDAYTPAGLRDSRFRDWREFNTEAEDKARLIAEARADDAVSAASASLSFMFDDENFAPDYTSQPRQFINPFAVQLSGDEGRRPACVAFFQQRLVYANWLTKPDTVAMSEVGDFDNFQRSIPTVDDDTIEATLASGQLNAIRAMIGLKRILFCFTNGAEFLITTEKGPVTPSNIDSDDPSRFGSGSLQPLVIGGVILFLDRGGHVREFVYARETNDYPGTDVGLLASHLFDDTTIVDWCHSVTPRSLVWAARADGMGLSFTYVREQNVAAWCRHTTPGGKIRSLTAIQEVGVRGETVWACVERQLNGERVVTIEKMTPRSPHTSVFLDSYISVENESPGEIVFNTELPPPHFGPVGPSNYTKGGWVKFTASELVLSTGMVGVTWLRWSDPNGKTVHGRIVRVSHPNVGWVEMEETAGYDDVLPVTVTEYDVLTKTFAGFDHLAGETVAVMADGSVRPSVVVAVDGTVFLATRAKSVSCGLKYEAVLQTNSLKVDNGEIRNRQKSLAAVAIDVLDTRGLWLGETEDSMSEKKPVYGQQTDPLTGHVEIRFSNTWNKSGSFFLKQRDPVPCTILALLPEVAVAG